MRTKQKNMESVGAMHKLAKIIQKHFPKYVIKLWTVEHLTYEEIAKRIKSDLEKILSEEKLKTKPQEISPEKDLGIKEIRQSVYTALKGHKAYNKVPALPGLVQPKEIRKILKEHKKPSGYSKVKAVISKNHHTWREKSILYLKNAEIILPSDIEVIYRLSLLNKFRDSNFPPTHSLRNSLVLDTLRIIRNYNQDYLTIINMRASHSNYKRKNDLPNLYFDNLQEINKLLKKYKLTNNTQKQIKALRQEIPWSAPIMSQVIADIQPSLEDVAQSLYKQYHKKEKRTNPLQLTQDILNLIYFEAHDIIRRPDLEKKMEIN